MLLTFYVLSVIVSLFFCFLFLIKIFLAYTFDNEYILLLTQTKELKLYEPSKNTEIFGVLAFVLLVFIPAINLLFSIGVLFLTITSRLDSMIQRQIQKDKNKFDNLIRHYYFDD